MVHLQRCFSLSFHAIAESQLVRPWSWYLLNDFSLGKQRARISYFVALWICVSLNPSPIILFLAFS